MRRRGAQHRDRCAFCRYDLGDIDFKGEIYTRQERLGMLLGTYEKACKPWSPRPGEDT